MPGERCPVCMKPLDASAAKCPHCGAPVPCAPKQGEPLATAYIRTDSAGPARYDISEGSYPKTEQIDPPRPSPVTETIRIETQQKSRIDELPVRAKKKSKAPLAILLAGLAVLVLAAVLILVLDPFNPGEKKNHSTPIKADVMTTEQENAASAAEPPETEEAGEIAEETETQPVEVTEPEEDRETGAVIIQAEAEQEEETGTPTAGTVHVGGVQIGQGYRSTPTPTPTPQTADTPTHSPTPVPTRIPTTTPTPTPVTGGTGGGNQQGGSRLDNIRANRRLYMTTKGKKACFVEVETAASVTKIRIVYPGNEVYRESTMPAATDTGSAYPKKWKIEISFFSKETRNQVSGTYTIIYYTGDDQYEEEVVWGGL